MATLYDEYKKYFTIDKAGLVPVYYIPTSLAQTQGIQTMPMCPEKSLGMVGKPTHYSPGVSLPAAMLQKPNMDPQLDHLATAASRIKISPNVYVPHNTLSSSSPGLSTMQTTPTSYNQSVENMYHQRMQLQYPQTQLAVQPSSAAAQLNLISLISSARPSPRLPSNQYLYNTYGSKYRYANPVVLQQYHGMPSPQEQWNQSINGLQKKSGNKLVTQKHPQSHGVQSDAIDINEHSSIGLPPTNTGTETSRFCKTTTATQNPEKCKDACNNNLIDNSSNSVVSSVADSENFCDANTNGNGKNKNHSLSMSWPTLSGDYPGPYPSRHPNPWPSSPSTPPLYTTQLPTQTAYPMPASSPTATYYPYANIGPQNAFYSLEDPLTHMTRPRYHPYDRVRNSYHSYDRMRRV